MLREEAIRLLSGLMFKGKLKEALDMAIKALEQEPTTKNDLGVDREQLKNMIRGLTKWYVKRDNAEVGQPNTAVGLLYDDVMFGIDRLPSVTPQEPILDKIRAEIEQLPINTRINWDGCCPDIDYPEIEYVDVTKNGLLSILDKYKAETEEDFIDECKRLDGDCDKCTHKYHCCSSERNGRH